MKIHFLLGLVGLAIGFAAPGFAQEKEADPQAVEQLRAEAKKFEEAYNNHDAAAVAALFTDDAVLVTPQGTFYGPQAIEKRHAKYISSNQFGRLFK
jgi:ketosteroid isomerase-like protein